MTDVKKDAPTSKLGIVERIMKTLKLDDEGRVYSFFARETKKIERKIVAINQNKTVTEMEYKNNLIILKENLDDAKINLISAMEDVDVERIKTNADKDSFASLYWERVEMAERDVERVEKEIDDLKTKYEDDIKALDIDIKECKSRIAMFN